MTVREARTIFVKMRDYRNKSLKERNLGKPVQIPPYSFDEVSKAIDVAIEALDRRIETSHVSDSGEIPQPCYGQE